MGAPVVAGGHTWADLLAFTDDRVQREVLGGALHVTPRPDWRHQAAVARIASLLVDWADQAGGEVAVSPIVSFSDTDVVVPDVVLIRAVECAGGLRYEGVPDLVVEVISRPTRGLDLGDKRRLYGERGVPGYWAVDLDDETVAVYRSLAAGEPYAAPRLYRRGDGIEPPHLPGLRVDVDRVFGPFPDRS
jgi:Uma2 family endonuclease